MKGCVGFASANLILGKFTIALMATLATGTPSPGPLSESMSAERTAPAETLELEPAISELIKAHNQARRTAKLPPLELDLKLIKAANSHARDMAIRQKMDHEGGDGSTPAQRVKREGFHFLRAAENVACGQRSAERVIRDWLESPGHRGNILGDYSRIGAARTADKGGDYYWCVEFGTLMPRLAPEHASVEVFRRINQVRDGEHLRLLRIDRRLARIAQATALELARSDLLRKQDSEHADLARILEEEKPQALELSQSVACGHPDAADLVESLLTNPDHKKRLLGRFTLAGVGYANAEDATPYWCVILGEP